MNTASAADSYSVSAPASVAVYCSASSALAAHFSQPARTIGRMLGENGLQMVFGGGGVGLMGIAARACKAAGGNVVGITTSKLDDLEGGWEGCDQLIVVESMPDRRTRMMDLADAFVILPGGLGTYEEFFEVVVGRQLGDHSKPIVIVNHDSFYDPMIAMIDHGITHNFIAPAIREVLIVVNDAADALPALMAHRPREHNPADFLYLPDHLPGEESHQLLRAS
ncbi:MAG: TIGR00730 family Rossman fold protein [Mycobacterium sp.]